MTRYECEEKVLGLLEEIEKACNAYKPGMCLCLAVDDGSLDAFALDDDENYAIKIHRFDDGRVMRDMQEEYLRDELAAAEYFGELHYAEEPEYAEGTTGIMNIDEWNLLQAQMSEAEKHDAEEAYKADRI